MNNKTHEENLLKIITLNCQGLNDVNKRKDVLSNLRMKSYNIYFLQDTHFNESEEKLIQLQWGYKSFFNSFKTNSRGVAIFFNNNCEFEIHSEYKDENGNYLILDATVENMPLLLINIYGPNSDIPNFYASLMDKIVDCLNTQYIIIGGDFNLVIDKDLDSMNYKHLNNSQARKELLRLIETLSLVDIFRENAPNLRRYTWRRKNPIKQARLNYFLISETLMNRVPQIKFENSYRSDHSPVGLSFKFNDFLKGKGLWKFNNSLLTDKIYIDIIKKTIVELKIQYACPIYNFNNLNTITNNDIQFTINDQLFMDILLTEIRGKSISYSSFKKKKLNEREKELEKDILLIEQNLTDDKLDINKKARGNT